MVSDIVLGFGRVPNDFMLVGEAPGREERNRGRPFVGRTGAEQEMYLWRHNLSTRPWYLSNVTKEYKDGNPDPTPEEIAYWSEVLEDEIKDCRPKLIIAVGRFAMRWFLGKDADLAACHGIPHFGGAFDPSLAYRACGAIVLPIVHPAMGFYDNDAKAIIADDYDHVARVVKTITAGRPVEILHDALAGTETYTDVSGKEFATVLAGGRGVDVFGFDTEGSITNGYPSDPWSLQVSLRPGAGMALRTEREDFAVGVEALQRVVDKGAVVAIHNAMFDIEMARLMGLELRDANLFDSMYAAYLMRLEPQGLKALAYRWLGIRMNSYEDTVGEAGRQKQIDYLIDVMCRQWPKVEGQLVVGNDGAAKIYTPQGPSQRASAILSSILDHPLETDVMARWKAVDKYMRRQIQKVVGPMPVGSLADLELEDAVFYSCMDSDATLRLYHALKPELKRRGLSKLMADGMKTTPIFEEMQWTGMHASRSHFQSLLDDMNDQMERLQHKLSRKYFDGEPFNPASHLHVADVMENEGLVGSKITKTGKVSTGKKSIEHLRHDNEAIGMIIDWRECAKVRDAFCKSIVERMTDSGPDLQQVRCKIKTTRVQTRRLAAAEPNLLAIPARKALGKRVRDGYQTPEGQVFGAWDLSQIEMRFMAYLAKDPLLIKRFQDGADVHSETAATIFKIDIKDVDKMKHRMPAKTAGFGIINGISGPGLYDQLRMAGCEGWNVDSCNELIAKWFEVYPAVQAYMKFCAREAKQHGLVRDIWGMPRYLPGAWSDDRRIRGEAERAASSHKIQGGAQGMIQNSMRWIDRHIRDMQRDRLNVHWVMQIHDEVILRFDEDLWDPVNQIVMEGLTRHHGVTDMPMPVEAEGHSAKEWGSLKG